jgi:hypothetical protein
VLDYGPKRFPGGVSLRHWLPGEEVVKNRTQAVNIRRRGQIPFALGLLGRHVVWCPHNPIGLRELGPLIQVFGQAQNTASAGFQPDTNLNTIRSLVPGKTVSVALSSSAIFAAN